MRKYILIFILNSTFVFGGKVPGTVTTNGRASLNVMADELLIRGQINKSNATRAGVEKELKATKSQFERAFKEDLPGLKILNIRMIPIYPYNRPSTVPVYTGGELPGIGGMELPGMGLPGVDPPKAIPGAPNVVPGEVPGVPGTVPGVPGIPGATNTPPSMVPGAIPGGVGTIPAVPGGVPGMAVPGGVPGGVPGAGIPGMIPGGVPGTIPGGVGTIPVTGLSSIGIDPVTGLPFNWSPGRTLSGLKWRGELIIETIVPINGGDLQKLEESDVIKSTGASLKFIPNYSDTKKVQLRLDEMAFEDAKFKAGNLARLAGKKVGEVVSISENIGVPSGAPMMIDPVTGLPIKVEKAIKTIESNIIVTFKLRP